MSQETGFSIGDKIVLPTPDPEQQPAGQPEWPDVIGSGGQAPSEPATASELEQLAREHADALWSSRRTVTHGCFRLLVSDLCQKVQELTRKEGGK